MYWADRYEEPKFSFSWNFRERQEDFSIVCIYYLAVDVYKRVRYVYKLEGLKTKTMKALYAAIMVILNRGVLGTTVKKRKENNEQTEVNSTSLKVRQAPLCYSLSRHRAAILNN